MRRRLVISFAVVLLATAAAPATAEQPAPKTVNDPTAIEPGCYAPDIGTVQTAIGVNSSVDTVCFDAPTLVNRENMKFYTVDIVISGIDSSPWAGFDPEDGCFGFAFFGPFTPDCGHRQAAYEDVPVTLWFPEKWNGGNAKKKTLVQYHFSGSFSADEGEELVGLGAIQQGMAYTAHDGKFFEGVVATIVDDGPTNGNDVPVVSSSMTRDVASVASDWLARYTKHAPAQRYISGFSLGGWVMTGLIAGNFFGFEMANNHVDPDDLSSEPFYDAALYMSASGGPLSDSPSTTPGEAATLIPSIHMETEQDGAHARWPYVASWIDLVEDGEPENYIAYWSIRDQWHQPLETIQVNHRDLFTQDLRGPVVSAALKSLHRAVTKGEPLTSYMGGTIVPREAGDPAGDGCIFLDGGPDPDRRVQWETLDDQVTHTDPVALYSTDALVFDTPREPCGLEIDAFDQLQSALELQPAIVPPLAANRVGPHFSLGVIVPGEQFEVCSLYGDLDGFEKALRKSARNLKRQGVWKPLPKSDGTRVTNPWEVTPDFPFPPPGGLDTYPGIVGTFQEKGCE